MADRTVHELAVSTAITTSLEVGAERTQVDELLRYQVAYQPLDHFTLIVPRGVRRESLTILYEGQRLETGAMLAQRNDDEAPLRVNLPAAVIGRCQLQVRYVLSHEKPPRQASTLVTVPLVVPGEGELTENQLTVVTPPDISVHYPQGPWTTAGRASTSDDGVELSLEATSAIPEVTLAISSKQSPTRNLVSIERALVQTFLTDTARQDRVLLRLSANQPAIELTLPEGADMRSVVLAVNGRRVIAESVRQRNVTLSLADGTGEYVVEMRYHFAARPPPGRFALEGPQVKSARWVEQVYWELTMPAGEHALSAPAGYVEEQHWTWRDFFWRREPSLDEPGLENWIASASPGEAARRGNDTDEAGVANRYLFSTVGRIQPLDVRTLSRARLVLFASLPLLAAGLLLIYVRAARHPALLLLAGVALVGASVVAPESALLLAQASVLGLLLAAVAALLVRALPARPAAAPATVSGSSYVAIERGVTELYHRPPSGGSRPPSTSTDPLVPTSPEVES